MYFQKGQVIVITFIAIGVVLLLFLHGTINGRSIFTSFDIFDPTCQAKVSGGVYSDSFDDADCVFETNNVSISNGNVVPQIVSSAGTLVNGLVGLWHFDEISGSAIDAAGGNHGIPQGVIQGQAGKFGNAYNFSKYGWVFMPGNVPNTFNDSFTISAWFKRFSTTDDGYFFDTNYSGSSYTTLRLYSTSMQPQVGNSTKSSKIVYSINADTLWHNYVFIRNKQEGKIHLYLDGKDTGVTGDGDPIVLDFSGVVPFVVGKRHQDHLHDFNGTIDEVAMWNRNLSISEITTVNASAINYYLTPGNLTSKQIYLDNEYNSMIASWDDPSIKIELTSDGNNWCELSSGVRLRKTTCTQLPANNFTYRATFSGNVNLSSVNFAFENYFDSENCWNGFDEDEDGAIDCADSDCVDFNACKNHLMTAATREECVAPCGVFFDAVDRVDPLYAHFSGVHQERGYERAEKADDLVGVYVIDSGGGQKLGTGKLSWNGTSGISWQAPGESFPGPSVVPMQNGDFYLNGSTPGEYIHVGVDINMLPRNFTRNEYTITGIFVETVTYQNPIGNGKLIWIPYGNEDTAGLYDNIGQMAWQAPGDSAPGEFIPIIKHNNYDYMLKSSGGSVLRVSTLGGPYPKIPINETIRITDIPYISDNVSIVLGGNNPQLNDYIYQWEFGDSTSGFWTTGARYSNGSFPSKNKDQGFLAAHVYENAGNYNVTLKITLPNGTIYSYSENINVLAEPIGGWTTYYFSGRGDDDTGDGTITKPFRSWEKALSLVNTNTRLLFERGYTYPAISSASFNVKGPILFGAYGTGEKPKFLIQSGVFGTAFFYPGPLTEDVRFVDFSIESQEDPISHSGMVNPGDNALFLRVDLKHLGGNVYFLEYVKNIIIQEGTSINRGIEEAYSVWTAKPGTERIALLGNHFKTDEDPLTFETNMFRSYSEKNLIEHSLYDQPYAGSTSRFALRFIQEFNYGIVAWNDIRDNVVNIEPGERYHLVRNFLIFNNIFLYDMRKPGVTPHAIAIYGGSYITARNNIAYGLNVFGAISSPADTATAQYNHISFSNNLVYGNTKEFVRFIKILPKSTTYIGNISVVNNLVAAPFDSDIVGSYVFSVPSTINLLSGFRFDNNLIYYPALANQNSLFQYTSNWNLTGWQIATGKDVNSIWAAPQFTNVPVACGNPRTFTKNIDGLELYDFGFNIRYHTRAYKGGAGFETLKIFNYYNFKILGCDQGPGVLDCNVDGKADINYNSCNLYVYNITSDNLIISNRVVFSGIPKVNVSVDYTAGTKNKIYVNNISIYHVGDVVQYRQNRTAFAVTSIGEDSVLNGDGQITASYITVSPDLPEIALPFYPLCNFGNQTSSVVPDFSFIKGSRGIDGGVSVLGGMYDYDGNLRLGAPDIGPFEYQGSVCEDDENRSCLLQQGVCAGTNETCSAGHWFGCSAAVYLANNPNYEITETICSDGLDNDCDGTIDEKTTFYYDSDNDNYGNATDAILACNIAPQGYVNNAGDCNDNNTNVNPGKFEICGNSIDDNCDGIIDIGCPNCTDGEQNGLETGIDCGGSCTACSVTPPGDDSSPGGGGGGGSGGGVLPGKNQSRSQTNLTGTGSCQELWQCGTWSECVNGTMTRACEDINLCGSEKEKPETQASCGTDFGGILENPVSYSTIFILVISVVVFGVVAVLLYLKVFKRRKLS
ncbi:hypothetical protein J4233_02380 [Candidatus Pacearchaeota archaeon]|nr:hypothetical protein [Candidatus Pacearchaeota archaeon]